MIHATNKTIITSLIEVFTEILINPRRTFRTLDDDKPNRTAFNHRILELFPINLSLIVRDINAMNFITFRIIGITIKRTPTESRRTDKKIIKSQDVEDYDNKSPYPPSPTWIPA